MNFNAEPYAPQVAPRKMSDEALMKEKYEVLRKFERLSKMGVPMRKRFTMDSPLEEMKMELEFIKREKNMDATIKQFSEWFVTAMSGLEYGSKHVTLLKAFGLQLDGLSESAQMNVVDLEDDFEELYDQYGENLKMHPLVKIPMRACMMVYMVHLTNQMTRKAPIPNIDDIMRQNPDIARSLAAAAMQNQTQQMRAQPSQPQQFGGMPMPPMPQVPQQMPQAGPFNNSARVPNMPQPVASVEPPRVARREMRGPSGVDDILKTFAEVRQAEAMNEVSNMGMAQMGSATAAADD